MAIASLNREPHLLPPRNGKNDYPTGDPDWPGNGSLGVLKTLRLPL